MRSPLPLCAALLCCAGCLQPRLGDAADLLPLAVESLSLGELEPTSPPFVNGDAVIRVRFSEPVDAFSLSEETVMIVAGVPKGPCQGPNDCPEGLCLEGECFAAPVDAAFIEDANRPPLTASRRSRTIPMDQWLTADGLEVCLGPRAPLARPERYAIVLSAALRDRQGNPLVSADGRTAGFVYEFVTGAQGGVRPKIVLLAPAPGAEGVATNLAEVRVAVTGEVLGAQGDGIWLEGPVGKIPARVSPLTTGCPDAYKACFGLALDGILQPFTTYGLAHHDRLRDAEDRPVPASPEEAFITGSGPDWTPPGVQDLAWEPEAGCLEVRLGTDEAAQVRLRWRTDEGSHELLLPGFGVAHGSALPLHPLPLELSVDTWDAVGNQGGLGAQPLALTPIAAVAISEVLANPKGTEPAQEYVEIVNLGIEAVSLDGWSVTDTLAKTGDPLPPESLPPGAIGLVVPSSYQSGGVDPAPAPGTLVLRLQGSTLGSAGLANGGEPVFLLDSEGRVISRYPGAPVSGALPANGQSVGRELGVGCEARGPWRLHPEGSSTPGRLE